MKMDATHPASHGISILGSTLVGMIRLAFERSLKPAAWFAVAFVMIIATGVPALASPPPGTCFALQTSVSDTRMPATMQCAGEPAGYDSGALWLRLPTEGLSVASHPALLIHSTRFDRLRVFFVFADGSREIQGVQRGAFENHWHMGGQLEFRPRSARVPLSAIWLRIDRLQSYDLLRVRLVPVGLVSRQFELSAALIGAAVASLAATALYNLALAVGVRRRLFLWHGMWAATMVFWGLVWSQAALLFFPMIAGTTASQLATVLACLAIAFATLSALEILVDVLSKRTRRAIHWASFGVVILGLWSCMPNADLGPIGSGLAILTLAILAGTGSGLVIGCRRGNQDARGLLLAWLPPMLVLGATQIFDFSTSLFGGGAQIAVLFASAFQAIALSVMATLRLGTLRLERDAAIASEITLAELAERDALTGLLNRRGFVRRCEQAFGDLHHVPFGLLLIDVDHFKHINDQFGHEIGDAVLANLGARLRNLEQGHPCLAGRLGGEEFVVGISGLSTRGLRTFADLILEVLGEVNGDIAPAYPKVTVSIGVASGTGSGPFGVLYGTADRALYEAKAGGRNRAVLDAGLAAA